MITIGYNQVQEKHVADSNSSAREDAHEAKKVYVGNKLAHVHVNDNTEFALRQTLNGYIHEDNDLYAKVRSIRGNTKVWNQLLKNNSASESVSGITITNNGDGTFTCSGTATALVVKSLTFSVDFPFLIAGHYYLLRGCPEGGSLVDSYCLRNNVGSICDTGNGRIFNVSSTSALQFSISFRVGTYSTLVFKPVIIDLTLIYGAGNEPTTVAEFEADFQKWFGRPIGAEPYDAGSLIPFIGTGIKSTGFNLWDEEWEAGGYNGTTGEKYAVPSRIRSANYIRVIPSSTYYFRQAASRFVFMYDSSKNYLGDINVSGTEFTISDKCCYITFQLGDNSNPATTYNNDICINLSNPTLNGTYVPYKATTVPIPITTLTGKQSGSSTSELIFPDGMKLAGSVKDEVYVEDGKTYAKKKVESRAYASGDESDTTVTTDGNSTTYYPLATPIVYEVDNYTLPLYYVANGTGTEEILSTATSAPADMDIEYRLRQRVRLVDMGTPGVLWADSDIDITKPDGFCDSPFTYEKSFFSWGNVVGHNPISNTAFDYDWGGINQAKPWYEGQVYGSTPGSTLTGNIPADAQYDAAKAVLGGNWRMPSSAEYSALFRICKFLEADGTDMDTSKTDKRVDMPDGNGGTVKGIYIESTVTGNRLFFSCSGTGNGRSWNGRGSYGYYWSSTWNSARNARGLGFGSGGGNPQDGSSRYYGFALRPVYPISQ